MPTVDRYTKIVLTIAALALTLLAARPFLLRPSDAIAQMLIPPERSNTAPKSYGKPVGFVGSTVWFEEEATGTLRLLDFDKGRFLIVISRTSP